MAICTSPQRGGWVAGWMDWWVVGWDGAMAICTSSQRGGVRGDHGLTPASSQRGEAMSTFSSLLAWPLATSIAWEDLLLVLLGRTCCHKCFGGLVTANVWTQALGYKFGQIVSSDLLLVLLKLGSKPKHTILAKLVSSDLILAMLGMIFEHTCLGPSPRIQLWPKVYPQTCYW